VKIAEINKVCFVGAGTMGCANAIVAGLAGYKVVIYDVSKASIDLVPSRFKDIGDYIVAQNICSQPAFDYVISQIECSDDLNKATSDADLVSESVFESVGLKRGVHAKLDQVCPPHTIITTNTSSIMVSEIQDVMSDDRGALFAALHSHLGSVLIDIVGGVRTSQDTVDVLERYVLSLNAVPLILKKENPGYVVNAMLGPVLTTAMLMRQKGEATIEEVDLAWMIQQGVPIGPFGLIDLFGINVIYDSWQKPRSTPNYEENKADVMALVQPYIDRQELGAKSMKGFYQYPQPSYQSERFVERSMGNSIDKNSSLLCSTLIQNAIQLAVNEVASPEVIDGAWKVAMSVSKGPFELLKEQGREPFLQQLDAQLHEGWFSEELALPIKAYLKSMPAA
jgi:enoyl-CoA hydratase/3-hydroxyacyl-CoA dehydrogenase